MFITSWPFFIEGNTPSHETVLDTLPVCCGVITGVRIVDKHCSVVDANMPTIYFTIDVAPCFVLLANRSLVDILHNNGLRHSALSFRNGLQQSLCQTNNQGLNKTAVNKNYKRIQLTSYILG
jgi:hypothetical protein